MAFEWVPNCSKLAKIGMFRILAPTVLSFISVTGYIPFLEEQLGPIQASEITNLAEEEKVSTEQDTYLTEQNTFSTEQDTFSATDQNTEEDDLAGKIAALKSPSGSSDYFNYFMSQFVR